MSERKTREKGERRGREEKGKERKREKESSGYQGFNLWSTEPVTIWNSRDTGEVIDYHGTDLSPPSPRASLFLLFSSPLPF